MKRIGVAFIVGWIFLLMAKQVYPQSIELLNVERLDEESFIIPAQCNPGDLIVVINSSIEGLMFESNILPDNEFKVIHFEEANQYIICHEREKFKLTVSGPGLQSYDIDIFNLDENHVYRLTSNILRGTIIVNTNPGNAIVFLPTINVNASSGRPITNNSGRYRINILKDSFKTIDTLLTIPSLDTTVYTFNLEPNFSSIILDLTTEGTTQLENPPILWIDERRISLDAMVRPERYRSFFDGVDMFSLYEGNIIPVPPGNHRIRIELPNYIPFETHIHTERGKTTRLPISLELVYGYITIIDESNSIGARAYVNNDYVGEVPVFKARTRVGMNTVRFEKQGYMTERDHFPVYVAENMNVDLYVSMRRSRSITFITEPSSADIFLNGERIGFSPLTVAIPAGEHGLQIRRAGYSTLGVKTDSDDVNLSGDTLFIELKQNMPFKLSSEGKNQTATIIGLDDLSDMVFDSSYNIPSTINLPFGSYYVVTKKDEKVTFRGRVLHSSRRGTKTLPSYSKSSFTVLAIDEINMKNLEFSIGRNHIFPGTGLSTTVLNTQYYIFEEANTEYKTLMQTLFFLNWDWRIGGSLLRQLDICFLGRYKYNPGLKTINLNFPGFHDAKMNTLFYGFEVSTRFSYVNLNMKLGQQIFKGRINVFDDENKSYLRDPIVVDKTKGIISFGLTVNNTVERSNNMARLWHKPMINRLLDYIALSRN